MFLVIFLRKKEKKRKEEEWSLLLFGAGTGTWYLPSYKYLVRTTGTSLELWCLVEELTNGRSKINENMVGIVPVP